MLTMGAAAIHADGLTDGSMFIGSDELLYRVVSADSHTCELAGTTTFETVTMSDVAEFIPTGPDWNEPEYYEVIGIGKRAFCKERSRATSLAISPSVQYIAMYAFSEPNPSGHLTEITVPGTVKEICQQAFDGNPYIEVINVEDGVTTIGQMAFDYCESLNRVSIPKSVKSLGESLFVGSDNISEISIDCNLTTDGMPLRWVKHLDKLTIGPNCSRINAGNIPAIDIEHLELAETSTSLYLYESSLNSLCPAELTVNRPLRMLSGAQNVFDDVSGITTLTVGDGVRDVTPLTIDRMSQLQSMTIGADITELPLITSCAATLRAIVMRSTIPPSTPGFAEEIYNRARLHVPDGCRDEYAANPAWAPFYAPNTNTGVTLICDNHADSTGSITYHLDGRPMGAHPAPGIYVRDGHKILIKN